MDSQHRGYGGKVEARKRCEDSAFLARVEAATLPELIAMLDNHRHKGSPAWKRVCLAARIRRLIAAARLVDM